MIICKASREHLDALIEIENSSFDLYSLSKRAFLYHIKKNLFLVATIDKKVAGYILIIFPNSSTARVYSIATKEKFRGLGIARGLLKEALNMLKDREKITLEVKLSNKKAIELYKHFGFVEKSILEEYYNGEDGIKMVKYLIN